ncbi:MAG: DnaJ domain-containing protein [Candidatus Sumerlaeota bacterium]|nr:DnaJ domain-containing protein [Candidatus Sumerlaeota bacterium]
MSPDITYYEILDVRPGASDKEIKQAYYRLARDLHPDKAANKEERKKYEQLFAEISKAYNVLKEKSRRAEYDRAFKRDEEKKIKAGQKVAEKKDGTKDGTAVRKKEKVAKAVDRSGERILIARRAYNMGMHVMKLGDYDQAVGFFEAAINNDDSEAVYFYRLAMAMVHGRKSFSRTVESCNRAVEMDPYNMDYKLLLGEIYEKAGGISKAKDIYEEILKWDSTHEMARQHLAALGFKAGGGAKSFFKNILKKLGGGK